MTISTTTKPARAVLIGVVLAVVAAACSSGGSSGGSSGSGSTAPAGAAKVACATGTLTGAGSTFVQTIAQQWIKDFEAACPGATVNYQGVGSGAGIQQFTAGTVDFGASDVPMKPDEQQAAQAKGGPVLHIPWSAGGVAVMYRLSGVTDLKLSPETLAGIFAGTIKRWNDPKIVADNAGTPLPATAIQVVHRSDGSGTTSAFTSFLTATAPSVWTAGAGKEVPWPTGQGAKGSDGLTAVLKQTDGAIGYAEVSFARANSLGMVKIKNAAGRFVEPSGPAVSAALAGAAVPADLKVQVNYTPSDPAAYPISTPTWAIVFQKPADAGKAKLLKAFLAYALGAGQDSADRLFYAPLPKDLIAKAKAAVDSIAA